MPSNPNQLVPTEYGPMQITPTPFRRPQPPMELPIPAPPNPFRLLRGSQDQGRGFPMPEPLAPPSFPGARSGLTLGQDQPMDLPEQAQFPSGFDPSVQSPGSASYGGPKLNTREALAGLRGTQVGSNMGPYGSREELYKQAAGGGGSQWSQAMAQDTLKPILAEEQFGRDQSFKARGATGDALTGQHPAILGLQQFEAEQKSLPQQYEAQGRILAEREQARGLIGGARANAQGRSQSAAIAGLAPLWNQLGEAQEREQQSMVDGLDDIAPQNAQAVQALRQAIMQYYQMLGFSQPGQ